MKIIIHDFCGNFAENKDLAKEIRENYIKPAIDSDKKIILSFKDVDSSTQSFIHALISEFFQNRGESLLNIFEFHKCNKTIKSLISTVINYSLE